MFEKTILQNANKENYELADNTFDVQQYLSVPPKMISFYLIFTDEQLLNQVRKLCIYVCDNQTAQMVHHKYIHV